jgi:hypothetical protein
MSGSDGKIRPNEKCSNKEEILQKIGSEKTLSSFPSGTAMFQGDFFSGAFPKGRLLPKSAAIPCKICVNDGSLLFLA